MSKQQTMALAVEGGTTYTSLTDVQAEILEAQAATIAEAIRAALDEGTLVKHNDTICFSCDIIEPKQMEVSYV